MINKEITYITYKDKLRNFRLRDADLVNILDSEHLGVVARIRGKTPKKGYPILSPIVAKLYGLDRRKNYSVLVTRPEGDPPYSPYIWQMMVRRKWNMENFLKVFKEPVSLASGNGKTTRFRRYIALDQ